MIEQNSEACTCKTSSLSVLKSTATHLQCIHLLLVIFLAFLEEMSRERYEIPYINKLVFYVDNCDHSLQKLDI